MMRNLTALELSAIHCMGAAVEDESLRLQMKADLETSLVEPAVSDNSRLIFHIAGLERGPYVGQDSFRGIGGFPVEGQLLDSDGARIEVYLYHVDGRIYELELVRPDGGAILSPQWDAFVLKD